MDLVSSRGNDPHVVVVGAGVGGLTAGALLLKAGYRVTVLEAQAYPGGCAGTFAYQGYRFDAGATLAGGFAPGGPHQRLAEALGLDWPIDPVDPAWVVHLPDGRQVTQWADPAAWEAEWRAVFPESGDFWRRQSKLADLSWDVSSRPFPWPPQSPGEAARLAASLRPRTLAALPHLGRRVADLLPAGASPMLRSFVDANLLISAQCTAAEAGALYGSAALDLPRRGVNAVRGGIGAIAETLVAWIRAQGGEIGFKQTVERIELRDGRAVALHIQARRRAGTRRVIACDQVLANVTPWALQRLLGEAAPAGLRRETRRLGETWGACMLYLGLDASKLPVDMPDHHQVIVDADRPLGETNSVFLSISDARHPDRAPAGRRAANISTHTAIAPWWALREDPAGETAYLERRARYTEAMLDAAERAVPGLKSAVELCLPATPVTYQHWTGRPRGMVGGFPQGSIFAARGPRTAIPNLWLVGDSIFPGQSTAGVTLGGMRVAEAVLGGGRGPGRG